MLAAEVTVCWEHDRLDVRHVSGRSARYVIGEAVGCDCVAPGLSRHELVRVEGDAALVRIPGQDGEVRLGLGQHLTVGVGTLSFRVSLVQIPDAPLPRARRPVEEGMGVFVFTAAVLHAVCAAVMLSMPRDVARLAFGDMDADEAELAWTTIPLAPEEPQARDWMRDALAAQPEAGGDDAPADVPAVGPVRARPSPGPSAALRRDRARAEALAVADQVAAQLGSTSSIVEGSALGSRAMASLASLETGRGSVAGFGDPSGLAGGGPPGGGGLGLPGGGGFDVGPLSTRPSRLGPGGPSWVAGLSRSGGRTPKAPREIFKPGKLEITDGLDFETVRRVIRNHVAEYRYCFEKRLNVRRDLEGKITVKFIIGGRGDVISTQVTEDTTSDAELSACLVGKVQRWAFPAPAGGGTVVVRYPFVFKAAGAD